METTESTLWERLASRLWAEGWSLGWTQYETTAGGMLWQVDASRGGQRLAAEGQTREEAFTRLWQLARAAAASLN